MICQTTFWQMKFCRKLSLANRLIQQRTCRRWRELMPFNDESVNVIPLIKEMLELWHKESEAYQQR